MEEVLEQIQTFAKTVHVMESVFNGMKSQMSDMHELLLELDIDTIDADEQARLQNLLDDCSRLLQLPGQTPQIEATFPVPQRQSSEQVRAETPQVQATVPVPQRQSPQHSPGQVRADAAARADMSTRSVAPEGQSLKPPEDGKKRSILKDRGSGGISAEPSMNGSTPATPNRAMSISAENSRDTHSVNKDAPHVSISISPPAPAAAQPRPVASAPSTGQPAPVTSTDAQKPNGTLAAPAGIQPEASTDSKAPGKKGFGALRLFKKEGKDAKTSTSRATSAISINTPSRLEDFFNHKFFKAHHSETATGTSMSALKLTNQMPTIFFHPQSLFIQLWYSFYLVIMTVNVIMLPLCIAWGRSYGDVLRAWYAVPTITMLLDIIIKYRTGLFIEQTLEMDLTKIRMFWLKNGSLVYDFVTMFPWVYVVDVLAERQSVQHTQLRLICLVGGLPFFSYLISSRRISYIGQKITLFIRIYGINGALVDSGSTLLLMHFNACAVMILRKLEISETPAHFKSELDHYSVNLFGAAGEMLANGFGAEIPTTTVDRFFKILNLIFSAMMLALFIGNVTALMIGLDRYNEILEEVNQYISYKGFGESIRSRIIKYYQFKYSGGKFFDENHLILKVPFFKDADKYFITQVVVILKVHHYLPGDYVIEEGTTGDMMFFIQSGTVEAIINGVSRARLSPGLFFGEIALLFGRMKRTASIRAVTHCILYSLSRSDLNSILELNPVMAEKMKAVAGERLEADAKAKQLAASGPAPPPANPPPQPDNANIIKSKPADSPS